jgi:Ras-related protein Rab-8A
MVLVGNKQDMEERREVTTMEGMELAKNWNARFFESSAFRRHNVDEPFFSLVDIIRNSSKDKQGRKSKKVNLKNKIRTVLGCTIS